MGTHKERLVYWDIVKAIAIILVIVGHTSNLFQHPLLMWIYSFHMPLFMIVSGFFFGYTAEKGTGVILKNRLLNTLLPILIIATIVYISRFDRSLSFGEQMHAFTHIATHHLWFLWALLVDSLIVLSIHKLIPRLGCRVLAACFCCAVFLLTPDYLNQLGAKALFPCFFFGYCISTFSLVDFYKKHRLGVTSCAALFYCVLIPFFTVPCTFYETGIYIFNGAFSPLKMTGIYFYRAFIGVAGSVLLMCVVYEIKQFLDNKQYGVPYVEKCLASIGKHTLGIYIFHTYLQVLYTHLPYVPEIPQYRMSPVFAVVYTLVMLVLSYYITLLFSRFSSLILNRAK